MFSFPRMLSIAIGAVILILGVMIEYVGYDETYNLIGNVPGFEYSREYPLAVWIIGGALIAGAFLYPSGQRKPKGEWESNPF